MNSQQRTVRPTLIDLNIYKLRYNQFIISMERCDGNCNAVEYTFLIKQKT